MTSRRQNFLWFFGYLTAKLSCMARLRAGTQPVLFLWILLMHERANLQACHVSCSDLLGALCSCFWKSFRCNLMLVFINDVTWPFRVYPFHRNAVCFKDLCEFVHS